MPTVFYRLNYLHYGDALDKLSDLVNVRLAPSISKEALLRRLCGRREPNRFISEVVRAYGGLDSPCIETAKFVADIRRSRTARRVFNALGCRGFSFDLYRNVRLTTPLREGVGIRIAAVPADDLFYPPGVRRAFRNMSADETGHSTWSKYPCIGFALGVARGLSWYICCLQSDIASYPVTAVSDHFRGWRNVVFPRVLSAARREARTVYLCRSTDAISASAGFPFVNLMYIYDGTAKDLAMKEVRVARPLNVQVQAGRPSVYTTVFHSYDLRD